MSSSRLTRPAAPRRLPPWKRYGGTAALLLLAALTGCKSLSLSEASYEITVASERPIRISSRFGEPHVVVVGFGRTRRVSEVTPTVGFGVGVGASYRGGGGVGFGPSLSLSHRAFELPVDDVRPRVVEALRAHDFSAHMGSMGAGGRSGLTIEGHIGIRYENRFLNGLYRVLVTGVPLFVLGVPLHENGVVIFALNIYDSHGLVEGRIVEAGWSLWSDVYNHDENEEEARLAAIDVAIEELCLGVEQLLGDAPK